MTYQVDAKAADDTILHQTVDVHFLGCGIEGSTLVTQLEGHHLVIGIDLQKDCGTDTLWECVVHHVDHSLLDSQTDARRCQFVELHVLADASHEDGQSWNFLHIVDQRDATVIVTEGHTALILDGEQRDVVALRDVVHKLTLCQADFLDEGAGVELLG